MKFAHMTAAGFTLVEMMIVVAMIGLLAAIAAPNYARARVTSQRNLCIKNLQRIEDAKEQWAADRHYGYGQRANRNQINAYFQRGVAPACPANGRYRYRPLGTDASCTILNHSISSLLDSGGDDDE